MRKNKILKTICFLGAIALGAILRSCTEAYVIDMHDPRLPAYSESGANAGGAYINGRPYRNRRELAGFGQGYRTPQITFRKSSGITELELPDGRMVDNPEDTVRVSSFTFTTSGNLIDSFFSAGIELPLVLGLETGSKSNAKILFNENPLCSSYSGNLFIRYVRLSDDRIHAIVAGTFRFYVDDECGLYEVSAGRFDYRFELRTAE